MAMRDVLYLYLSARA